MSCAIAEFVNRELPYSSHKKQFREKQIVAIAVIFSIDGFQIVVTCVSIWHLFFIWKGEYSSKLADMIAKNSSRRGINRSSTWATTTMTITING